MQVKDVLVKEQLADVLGQSCFRAYEDTLYVPHEPLTSTFIPRVHSVGEGAVDVVGIGKPIFEVALVLLAKEEIVKSTPTINAVSDGHISFALWYPNISKLEIDIVGLAF